MDRKLLLFHSNRKELARLEEILHDHFDVYSATTVQELTQALGRKPRVVIAELLLPLGKGVDLVRLVRHSAPQTELVVLSAIEAPSYAVAAAKAGAFGFLTGKDGPETILTGAYEAFEQAEANGQLPHSVDDPPLAGSGTLQDVLAAVPRIGKSARHVLILGELGTGRKSLARALHRHSPWAGAMHFVDCRDAARGPLLAKFNALGPASVQGDASLVLHSTLCLLNVELLPAQELTQLRALSSQPVYVQLSPGSSVPMQYRIIAVGTVRYQPEASSAPEFAPFLAPPICAEPIEMPPLRCRLDDLPELCELFFAHWASRYGCPGKRLSADALEVMSTYGWPSNLLELSNLVERLTLLCPRRCIDAASLPLEIHIGGWRRGLTYRDAMERLERELLLRVLDKVGGCRRRAAERLQLSYSTLKFRLRKLQITAAATADADRPNVVNGLAGGMVTSRD
jgi:two-component system, NtrC family, response regulator PilR